MKKNIMRIVLVLVAVFCLNTSVVAETVATWDNGVTFENCFFVDCVLIAPYNCPEVKFYTMIWTGCLWDVLAGTEINDIAIRINAKGDTLPETIQKVWDKIGEAKLAIKHCN